VPYHSQWGQDKWLEENVFQGRRNGVFVEIGAYDGVHHSNTLFFEEERDWTGLLIEAHPDFRDRLASNRPKAKHLFAAITDHSGLCQEFVCCGEEGWSGIGHFFSESHRSRVDHRGWKYGNVLAETLENALKDYPRIDYLSIDVEGAEAAIFASFPFAWWHIECISAENNEQDDQVSAILEMHGYKRIGKCENDDIYRLGGL